MEFSLSIVGADGDLHLKIRYVQNGNPSHQFRVSTDQSQCQPLLNKSKQRLVVINVIVNVWLKTCPMTNIAKDLMDIVVGEHRDEFLIAQVPQGELPFCQFAVLGGTDAQLALTDGDCIKIMVLIVLRVDDDVKIIGTYVLFTHSNGEMQIRIQFLKYPAW